MSDRPIDLFERQYGQGLLQYHQGLPRLRRLLQPWVKDRFDVTRDVVKRLCATPGPRRLLDFGCGDGRIARLVASAAPEGLGEIIGVDISPSRITEAEVLTSASGGAPRIRFMSGDESVIEEASGEGFDIALCIAVFGQVYDLYGVGRKLYHVLCPEGRLVAEFANYAYIRRRLRLLFGTVPTVSPAPIDLWPKIGWDSGEIHYFSRETSVAFLEHLGFVIESVHPTGLLANVCRVWAPLLATGFVIVARRPS